eukprot:CAMPEP_0206175774 /NCGR_PEP_ID=MMETSP1474-20131121/56035_1 /ASSEMBLY_ACC=CAM_ASM_001110 /TAXON_ID=97495 /ORGANISM="Imantonia sp., Strain RCC918" /LENGTH=79 /DNA_ID=CAMNT_0053586291 /DNA_START=132 /DNA_END=368 /DNA_ORIENTATION=+
MVWRGLDSGRCALQPSIRELRARGYNKPAGQTPWALNARSWNAHVVDSQYAGVGEAARRAIQEPIAPICCFIGEEALSL